LKRELQRPRIALCLLVTLSLALFAVVGVPVLAQPSFNGDVEIDFTGPGVLTFPDPNGQNVFVPGHPSAPISSGWDIKDVRVMYNSTTDILYVGLNSYQTVGDADTDGNEGLMTYDSGVDVPNLGVGETVSVFFDLDQDGNWDVIAGVPSGVDFSGFTIKSATGSTAIQAFFGPTDLTAHLGIRYWTPGSAPDLEFQILDFDGLPNQDGALSAFTIGAFMGSSVDVSITEDLLIGSTGPAAINIVKKTNGTDNNSPTGPYVAVNDTVTWTYNVTNPGSVNLTSIVVTDDNGTPGNLLDDWSPTFIGGDDGSDGILEPYSQTGEAWIYEALGKATLGQYANSATATGYSDGFPVSASDPDHYRGVDARISIQASDTNPVNTAHNFTVTVEKNDGTSWGPAVGVNVTPWLLAGSVGLITSSGPYTTDGSGHVIVTVNSSLPGTATVHASATVDVAGIDIAVATDGYGAVLPLGNVKTWEAEAWIHIEKHTNGQDADDGPGPSIPVGDNVTWTYNVTNIGDLDLDPVVVVDDNGTPGNLSDDFNPTYMGGDDSDGKLNPLETWYYSYNGTAKVGQYANVATVTGKPPVGANVSDDDPSHYFGLGPDIDIEKYTNGVNADDAPGPYISINSSVTWTYIVTNTGAVNLTSVNVTDDHPGVTPVLVGGDDGNDGILEPYSQTGETWTYQATGVAVAGQYANVGTVVGYYGAVQVTDSDPSHYHNRPTVVGWETYPVSKVRVLLPWIVLLGAVVGAGLLVLRHRRVTL